MHAHIKPLYLTLIVGAVLALVGCGGSSSSDSLEPYKSQKLVWERCDPATISQDDMAILTNVGITLEQFGSRLTCALMRAPRDYANPEQGELVVALMRVAAEDPQYRRGAIFFNPGGPGADGLVYAPFFAGWWSRARPEQVSGPLYQQMAREFDMIGFSPRGTGSSTNLKCSSDALYEFFGTELDRSAQNISAMLANAKLQAEACGKNTLTPYINTEATARDLDLMRHLIGDEKLNYYGMSYGTWLGHWYASLFPERVGAMLFDGVVDLTRGLEETFLEQPMGFQRTFDTVIAPYANRHASVFFFDSKKNVPLESIFSSLSSRPFLQAATSDEVSEHLGSSTHASRAVLSMVAAKWLANTLDSIAGPESQKESALRAKIEIAEIATNSVDPGESNSRKTLNDHAKILAGNIATGYFARLSGEIDRVEISPSPAMNFSVVSNDYPMRKGIDEWISKTNSNAASYPLIGGRFTNWPGLYWKGPTVKRPRPENAARARGLVILHADNDARTPREGAVASSNILPNASYVSISYEYTHGVILPYGQTCVDQPIAQYFLSGIQPQPRIKCDGNMLPWDRATN